MSRITAVILGAILLGAEGDATVLPTGFATLPAIGADAEAPGWDVATLLTAARGAPPVLCALAAQSVRNSGWGDWSDAPVTPLRAVAPRREDLRADTLSAADAQLLLESLGADDACVRELSVRMLARRGRREQRDEVATGLIARLTNAQGSLREVAALGLGLVEPERALEPLIGALRDAEEGVRANAAWALGRLENGRALAPLLGLVGDRSEVVRAAAIVSVGQLDSSSAVATLARVVRQDQAPSVRRVAAWALGQLDAREAAEPLAAVLASDADARVREMAAWALGEIDARAGAAALATALRRDADPRVRETAAWALGELGDRAQVEVLGEAAARDADVRVRGTAAWAIGSLRGEGGRAPAGLLQVLKSDSEDARLKAAWALGQIGDSATIGAIRDALAAEKEPRVQRALIRALLKSGERSERALTELLDSKDPEVREAAVRGLAGRGSFNPWPWPWPRPRPFP